jgi:hypothetical protein
MPEQLHAQLDVGDFFFEWTVHEYEQHERNRRWHIVVSGLAVLFVVYGMMSSNFLFTLIVILAGIILFLQSTSKPIEVPVAITEVGIIIGRRFYAYDEFQSFYIVFVPNVSKTLYLETKGFLSPRITLPIEDIDAIELRQSLIEFIVEDFEKEKEPFSEQMRKLWKLH